jgi:hypothetical protein
MSKVQDRILKKKKKREKHQDTYKGIPIRLTVHSQQKPNRPEDNGMLYSNTQKNANQEYCKTRREIMSFQEKHELREFILIRLSPTRNI